MAAGARSAALSRWYPNSVRFGGLTGLSNIDARQIRAALDAGHAVIITVEYRGFTPHGELRSP